MVYADDNQRKRVITGLRGLVTLLETRPELPVPSRVDLHVFPPRGTDEAMRAQVDRIAALLGAEIDTESLDQGHYKTSRSFGPVKYTLTAILAAARARHEALMSYEGAVIPGPTSETPREM